MAVAKLKKCKECGSEYLPTRFAQVVCSPICGINHSRKLNEKKVAAARKADTKERKEKIKTHSDFLKDFEKVFNEFIRVRDKDQPCISCGAEAGKYTMSAGHHFPAGSFGNIRFDEINVNGQCWFNCNKNQHGNFPNYKVGLTERIGKEEYKKLEFRAYQTTSKLSIPEIKDLITLYRAKIKTLKAG